MSKSSEHQSLIYSAIFGMLFVIAVLTISFSGPLVPLVMANDTANVSVSIASTTALDVSPNVTSAFTNLQINSTSGVENLTLQNIGSVPITTVSVYATNDASNPYGTDSASAYDAGNLAQIDNTTSGTFFQINRNEFNESVWPLYVTQDANTLAFFRIRVGGTGEYFAALKNATVDDGLGCANGSLAISGNVHTLARSGDIDFTDNSFTQLTNNTESYGLADFTIGGNGYCVAVTSDCTELEWFRWNSAATPYDDSSICSNDYGLFAGTLNPGNVTNIRMRVAVPYGVADGSLTDGILTFTAA